MTEIIGYTFYDCTSLTSVNIPDGVTSIGEGAFYYCTGLTSLTLGTGLTTIDCGAFGYCDGLKSIYSLNPEPPACGGSDSFSSDTFNGVLYIPVGTVQVYANAKGWEKFKNIVPLGLVPPKVTTLEATDITRATAVLHGSVVIGNEDILHVGFEYWTDGGTTRSLTASNIDEGMFSATIKNILDDTKYYYRAYAETDSGTYYGEELSFTTDKYVNGIDGIATDGAEIVGYYSTDGQQITSPTKGVNIVRLSDGTTKKVLVK